MQALADLVARRESDMLVREGGGDRGGGVGVGGNARCNIHFLIRHDRQRQQRRTAMEHSRPRPPSDHHGWLWPCGHHFRTRAPSPFWWLTPSKVCIAASFVIYETTPRLLPRSTCRADMPWSRSFHLSYSMEEGAILIAVRFVIVTRDVSLIIFRKVYGNICVQLLKEASPIFIYH